MAKMINDHSFWAGNSTEESVLPLGNKIKKVSSAEGAGHLSKYEDTEEEIVATQRKEREIAKKNPTKEGFRH
jgi:hypothetical protein